MPPQSVQKILTPEPGETVGSLPECLAFLRQRMHEPPALVTLKKWSGNGVLDDAKRSLPAEIRGHVAASGRGRSRKSKGRVRYSLNGVLEIAEQRLSFTRNNGAQAPTASAARPAASTDDVQDLLGPEGVDALCARLSKSFVEAMSAHAAQIPPSPTSVSSLASPELTSLIERTVDAIASLEATRRAMMVKYDAELQMWKQRCADLQTQVTALRAKASDLDVMKTNVLLNNILDAVNRRD